MLGPRIIALATLGLTAPLAAQDSTVVLRGRVIDARTLAPVPGVAVALTSGRDTVGRATSDDGGFYAARFRADGRVVAHFGLLGYRRDSLALDGARSAARPARLDVAMTPLREPVVLATARVTAPRSAMEARARRAGGAFLGPADIARLAPTRTSDLLRSVTGLVVRDENGVVRVATGRVVQPRALGAAARRPTAAGADSTGDPLEGARPPNGGRPCVMRIGVDGKIMPEEFTVDEVPVSDVAAVEIYRGAATMPVEFSSGRGDMKCGLLMLWTRVGGPRAP